MHRVISVFESHDGRKCKLEQLREQYYYMFTNGQRFVIDCEFCERILNSVDDTIVNYTSKEIMICVVMKLYMEIC